MSQTSAIFLDAYRELNARKLFWITLILSGLVVLAFAMIGINEQGLRIMFWDVALPINSTIIPEDVFYKSLFVSLGINIWLTWIATILALVSTAGIFPDFIGGGAIDLVLSKPIGRLRLFLTKYAAGLLFVTLQVTVFSVASLLALGFRGGTWEPAVLLAIPLVVIFFSYLFCICVLLGLLTRSTIASLLLTLLIWFLIFGIHGTETGLLTFQLLNRQQTEALEKTIAREEMTLQRLEEAETPAAEEILERSRERLAKRREELTSVEKTGGRVQTVHRVTMGVKTALPKTSETIGLLERWLIDLAELPAQEEEQTPAMIGAGGEFTPDQVALQQEAVETVRSRSVWWILGTSLAFEAAVLALGGWIFCRRDF